MALSLEPRAQLTLRTRALHSTGTLNLSLGPRRNFVVGEYSKRDYEYALDYQRSRPWLVCEAQGFYVWMYQDRFYKDSERLSKDAAYARLVLQEQRQRQRVQRDQEAVARGATTQPASRRYIPAEVKNRVWVRDGGRCVQCGSQNHLEFDHVIPVTLGGSSTDNNLQLLCEDCNRAKGGHL